MSEQKKMAAVEEGGRRRLGVGFLLLFVGIVIIAVSRYTSGRSAFVMVGIGVLAIGLLFLLLPSVAKSAILNYVLGGALLGFSILCFLGDLASALSHHESPKGLVLIMALSYFGGWTLIGIGKNPSPRFVFHFLLTVTAITLLAFFVISRI